MYIYAYTSDVCICVSNLQSASDIRCPTCVLFLAETAQRWVGVVELEKKVQDRGCLRVGVQPSKDRVHIGCKG